MDAKIQKITPNFWFDMNAEGLVQRFLAGGADRVE